MIDQARDAFVFDEAFFKELKTHTESGCYLSAWKFVEDRQDLKLWPKGEGLRAAANLARNLGSVRLADALDWRNHRAAPENDQWFFQNQFFRMRVVGDLPVLRDIEKRLEEKPDMEISVRADLIALLGSLYGSYRDTGRALQLAKEAESLAGEDSWRSVLRSQTLEEADRYEEALEEALLSQKLKQNYRPAALQLSNCYVHLGKDEEAREVLLDTHNNSENAAFAMRLQIHYSENNQWEKGLWALDEVERLSPLSGKRLAEWLASRRADFYYQARDFKKYLEVASAGSEYCKKLAARIESVDVSQFRRKVLDVGFVRQHDMTCAPATMASIAKFWGVDHDHLEIADEICYEGTPWHKERQWCEKQGFVTKEFRVTAENTKELIDLGIPFTLTTSWIGGAHLQACIGYDELAECAIIRDPTHRHYGEFSFDDLKEEHPVEGPRGMLFIPKEKQGLIEDLSLDSSKLLDQFHDLLVALERNDLTKAMEAVATMRVLDGDHPLVSRAELSLARYQVDAAGQLRITKETVKRFPDSKKLAWQRLMVLQKNDRTNQQLELLREQVSLKNTDSAFYAEYGSLLVDDNRTLQMGEYYLRKANRFRRRDSDVISYLAWVHWKKRDFDFSVLLRRLASTLSEKSEGYANTYFSGAKAIRKKEEGFLYLEERLGRIGEKESGSWMTLIDAYDFSSRKEEALALLEKGLSKFEKDGYFLIFAAWKYFYLGDIKKAEGLFSQAEGRVNDAYRLRESAKFANLLGKRKLAKEYWEHFLKNDPANTEAHDAIAYYIYESEGGEATLAYFNKVCREHPYSAFLKTSYAEWLVDHDVPKAIQVLQDAAELKPLDVWIQRQLAINYSKIGEFEKAKEFADAAVGIDDKQAESYGVLADTVLSLGRKQEAVDLYKKAITLKVDYVYAFGRLMELAADKEEALEYLRFVELEMDRQVSSGDVVSSYYGYALRYLDEGDVRKRLESFCEQRPDLFETWLAAKDHALAVNDLKRAEELAAEIVSRFSLVPGAWTAQAEVDQQCGRFDEQTKHLEKAVSIAPSWIKASYLLAKAYERKGELAKAKEVLRRLIRDNPKVPAPYLDLTKICWDSDDQEEAIETISKCVGFSPDYSAAWFFLTEKCIEKDKIDFLKDTIDDSLNAFPGKDQIWTIAADVFDAIGEEEGALNVLDRGLEIHPRSKDLHDHKAFYMAKKGLFSEALEFIDTSHFKDDLPRTLQGRKAYIRYQLNERQVALEEMKSLTKKYPDYAFAHEYYTTWLSSGEEHRTTRDAAKKWILADPDSATAWGYLGQAEELLDNKKESQKAMERAFALDPSYTFAARRVFTWSLEEGDFEKAESVLKQIQYYDQSSSFTAGEIEFLLARKNYSEAQEKLIEFLRRDDLYESILKYINELFVSHQLEKEFTKTLKSQVKEGKVKSGIVLVGYFWNAKNVMPEVKRLKKLPYEDSLKIEVWDFFISWVVNLNEPKTSKKFAYSDSVLNSHPHLWGRVGWMLLSTVTATETIKWLSDYKGREDIQGWMLHNLGVAHACNNELEEAREVHAYAVESLPPDNSTAFHKLIGAYHIAASGRHEESKEILELCEPDLESESDLGLAALTKMLNSRELKQIDETWIKYTNRYPDGQEDPFLKSYIKDASKILKSRQLRVKGMEETFFTRMKDSSISRWGLVVIVYLIIRTIFYLTKDA